MKALTNTICLTGLVCILCSLTTGCATDVGGFSTWDGSPTAQTLQSAESARQVHLSKMRTVLDKIPKGSMDPNLKLKLKDVLYKLKNLDSVTEMGVNYRDYPQYVREARFSINKFQSECGSCQDIITLLNRCLDPYIRAQSHFGDYARMRKGTMGEHKYGFYLRDSWKTGSESINLFESNFNDF